MSLAVNEARLVVEALDVSWQDVPLRPETMAVWVGDLCSSERVLFTYEDAVEAIDFLLHTEKHRPALSTFIDEGRAQFKARRDAEHEAERLTRLELGA